MCAAGSLDFIYLLTRVFNDRLESLRSLILSALRTLLSLLYVSLPLLSTGWVTLERDRNCKDLIANLVVVKYNLLI